MKNDYVLRTPFFLVHPVEYTSLTGAVLYLKLDLVQGGVDTCQGDSGGPAVDYLLLPDSHDVRATLMGLVSWG